MCHHSNDNDIFKFSSCYVSGKHHWSAADVNAFVYSFFDFYMFEIAQEYCALDE